MVQVQHFPIKRLPLVGGLATCSICKPVMIQFFVRIFPPRMEQSAHWYCVMAVLLTFHLVANPEKLWADLQGISAYVEVSFLF